MHESCIGPLHCLASVCCVMWQAMKKIGLKTPPSGTAETMEQAMEIAGQIGSYPLIIRPAFTLGGSGGGIAYNVEEFHQIVESGLQASVTNQACSCTSCASLVRRYCIADSLHVADQPPRDELWAGCQSCSSAWLQSALIKC